MSRLTCLTPCEEQSDTKGLPVFELSSVSISMDKFKELYGSDLHIELYGYIKLVDNDNDEFYLFNQGESCAKVLDLSNHHSDILQGYRDTHPLTLPEYFYFDICLKDKKRNAVIIEECFVLRFSGEVEYDKELHYECKSKEPGLASVNYTIFRYAVLASVYVSVERTGPCGDPVNVSCGTISAKYKLGNMTGSRTFCYDPSTPHKTCWFAVPSYSSFLELKGDLKINGTDCSANFKFKVSDVSSGTYWQSDAVGSELIMHVEVNWVLPYFLDDGIGPQHAFNIENPDLTKKKSWVLENADALSWDSIMFRPEKRFRNSEHHQKQELSVVLTLNLSIPNDELKFHVSCGTISTKYKLGNMTGSRTFCYDPSTPHKTCWFAVPSYSSFLELKGDLKFNGTDCSTDFKFKVSDVSSGTYWQNDAVGSELTMYVGVNWVLPYFLDDDIGPQHAFNIEDPDLTKKKSWVLENADALSWDSIKFRPEKRFRNSEYHQNQELRFNPSPIETLALVEVYSVSVYAYGGGYLSLYGTIEYCDSMGENFYMFERDVGDAVVVKSGGKLPLIQAGRCSLDYTFTISLNLKDSEGREISKGSLHWDYLAEYDWYYLLLSSVVAGRVGYAAVHYSLFADAIEAKLKIVFVSPVKHSTDVCGRISTRYGLFRYFSPDEKIYESVWFERGHSNRVQLEEREELCLSKYAVVAPLGVCLIVHVDLCVWDGSDIKLLRATKRFDPPRFEDRKVIISPHQEIREDLYGVDVSVEWNGAVRSCAELC